MDANNFVFVKADLFLHEKSYEALRNFVISGKNVPNLYSLEYNVEKNKVFCSPYDPLFEHATLALVADKLAKGYIFLKVRDLENMIFLS